LVFVLEPTEAARLTRLLVADELDKLGFAILGKDDNNVPFRKLRGDAAKVDKGGVAVVGMPGGVRAAGQVSVEQLRLRNGLN